MSKRPRNRQVAGSTPPARCGSASAGAEPTTLEEAILAPLIPSLKELITSGTKF